MSTIDSFMAREAEEDLGWFTVSEMEDICPDCAESMKRKAISRVSVRTVFDAMIGSRWAWDATAQGGGNLDSLIKHWRGKEHPFGECKKWVGEHKGEKAYPNIKNSDAFCGKLKHLTEK